MDIQEQLYDLYLSVQITPPLKPFYSTVYVLDRCSSRRLSGVLLQFLSMSACNS